MTKYLLTVDYQPGVIDTPTDQWSAEDVKAHLDYYGAAIQELIDSGEMVDNHALTPPEAAKVVTSEWLHYGYAVVMLVLLALLRPGFVGRARTWWTVALAIQFWHHIEHLLLLVQAQTGHFLFGRPVPTSFAQLFLPRVELHLFYNSIVFLPMIVAMYLHLRPNRAEAREAACGCAGRPLESRVLAGHAV